MIEHGTVVGNVSRSHHPCGACGELVETCSHYLIVRRGPRRTGEERDAARRAQRETARLLSRPRSS